MKMLEEESIKTIIPEVIILPLVFYTNFYINTKILCGLDNTYYFSSLYF